MTLPLGVQPDVSFNRVQITPRHSQFTCSALFFFNKAVFCLINFLICLIVKMCTSAFIRRAAAAKFQVLGN